MYSRSIFTSNVNVERTLMNPNGITNNNTVAQFSFSNETINAIKAVQQLYTFNLANATYSNIPTNYNQFLYLYGILVKTINSISDKNLKLLFQTTIEGLSGAMNAFGLSVDKTELSIKINFLEKTISDFESKINIVDAATVSNGQYSLKKSFTLSPLFSYYIMLYGLPEAGVGFDQNKLSILMLG